MVNMIASVLTSVATNSNFDGWWDRKPGIENADICSWTYGKVLTNPSGKTLVYHIQVIHTKFDCLILFLCLQESTIIWWALIGCFWCRETGTQKLEFVSPVKFKVFTIWCDLWTSYQLMKLQL